MTVLRLHSETLQPGWLDIYGHLNQAYYLLPFSNASWVLQDYLGVGRTYYEATGGAIYTVASHITYRREVRAPALLTFETIVTEVSEKRFAFAHRMMVEERETTIFETVSVHFDTKRQRTSPLPTETFALLQQLCIGSVPSWTTGSFSLLGNSQGIAAQMGRTP